eukprot:scaffold37468_cov48-Attheya_sp.AAC.1
MPKEINGMKLKDLDAQKAHVQTAEGDGKMSHHITGCFTSKGDGKYAIPGEKIQGAAPPYIIHAKAEYKGKTKAKLAQEYKWYEDVSVEDLLGRERKIGDSYLQGLGQDKAHEIQDPAD